MKINVIHIVIIVLCLSSCLKKETPIPAPIPGDIETVQIEVGYPYTYQVYYDCGTNEVVKTNTKYDWDLSFECTEKGFHVLLNTAKGVFIANLGSVAFSSVTSTSNATWLWDSPNGNLNSTAFGDWRNTKNIYIIDRQFDENGNHLGYKKIQFMAVDNISYTFKFADLDGQKETVYTINKDVNLNFIHFSLNNEGETRALEPNKNDWDLLFTNHYHKFDNLELPFVLTQVLTNKFQGVKVAEDLNGNFNTIILSDTGLYIYTSEWDQIGYDWKIRNNQDNSFTIDENKSFIIKTTKGWYYKLRFIDFYDDTGNKGYPKFEIQKL